jgi:lysophospholipase L1-like esterase
VVLLAVGTSVHAAEWIQSWGTAPLPPSAAVGPFAATPSFSNQTLRETVRVSAGGGRIRIRFTNEYGTRPLAIGAARVALLDEKGAVQSGTQKLVKFSGVAMVTIPPGTPLLSDPIDLSVKPLGSLSISIFLPQDTGPCTCHQPSLQTMQVSDTGDLSDQPFTPKQSLQTWAFISGVMVETGRSTHAVVVLGDSISDGIGSTVDANHRWPDLLAARLEATRHPWGVVNMGISGNQILADGAGQSALSRFDRDVLSVPGVKAVILFEGVNDLGIGYGKMPFKTAAAGAPAPKPTADSLIAGLRQLIVRAHLRDLKVIGATITPYEGAAYYSPDGEAVRQDINRWIRSTREFDGVIDFDALMRDPAKPTQIKEGFTVDHLHGSDAGYAAMAAAIDLGLLD